MDSAVEGIRVSGLFRVQGVIRMRWGDRALTCGDPRTPPEPEGGAPPCRGGPRSRPSGQDIIRLAIGPVWQRLGHLRYGRFPHRFPTRVAEDDLGGASGCDRDRSRRRARPRARSGGADERVSPMDGRLPGGRCSPHGGAHRPWPLVTLRGHGARLARPSPSRGGRDGLVGTQAGTPTSGGATPASRCSPAPLTTGSLLLGGSGATAVSGEANMRRAFR